jgi:hypothetical protein
VRIGVSQASLNHPSECEFAEDFIIGTVVWLRGDDFYHLLFSGKHGRPPKRGVKGSSKDTEREGVLQELLYPSVPVILARAKWLKAEVAALPKQTPHPFAFDWSAVPAGL